MKADRASIDPAALLDALSMNSTAAGGDIGSSLGSVLAIHERVFGGLSQLESRLQVQPFSSGEGRGKTLI